MRLCTPFTCGPLLHARRSGWASMSAPELTQRRAPPARAAAAGNKSIVAQWAEDAGLRTSVSLEDFLGDRCARSPHIACALCGNPFVLTQGVHQQVRRAVKVAVQLFTCVLVCHLTWTLDSVRRTESLKPPPNGPVTWPSEQWTSMWKVCGCCHLCAA